MQQRKWWEDDELVQPGPATRSQRPLVHQGPGKAPAPQTGAQSAKDEADARRAQAEAAFAARKAEADARLAEANAALAELKPDPSEINPADPKNRAKIAGLNSLANQLNRVEELYRQNIAPTSGLGGVLDYLPTEANRQFDTAAAGLAEQGLAAFRVPGVGAQSDAELRQFVQANKPSASDYDASIEEKLRQLRDRLNETRAQYGLPPVGGPQDSQPRQDDPQAIAAGAAPPPQGGGPRPDQSTQYLVSPSGNEGRSVAGGDMRIENNPAWAGANAKINQLLKSGASDQEIMGYVKTIASSPQDQVKARKQLIEIRKFQRANPGYRGDYHIDMERWQVPNSIVNRVAAGPAGAYAINAADSLSMGTLDNMTANPALTRAGIEGVRQANPNASLAGTVSGGVLAAGAAELGAARLGLQGGRAALAGDAAYGAAYGAGSADEGSRVGGALTGSLAAGGGGIAGRSVVRGAGRALTGTRDAGTRLLRESGVSQTLGQIAGRGGVVGRSIKKMEDALESVPILGSAIARRRAEGVEGFNQAAFREALEPIPPATVSAIGEEGVEQAQAATGDAYTSALSNVRVQAAGDKIFVRDLNRAMTAGKKLHPETAKAYKKLVENEVAPELADGTLTGEGYQTLRRIIREERALWQKAPNGRQYVGALRQLEGSLESLVRRQAPDVVPALNKADQAYRQSKIVEDAVARGVNTGGQFSPAQLGMAARANAKKFGGTQSTTQRPFFDLQRAAQDILPSQVPNSGTADRAMASALLPALPMLAGGAGAYTGLISPEEAAIMSTLGLPFTKAGQAAFQKLLIDRPEVVRAAGEQILKRNAMGGLLGAPVGASLAAQ